MSSPGKIRSHLQLTHEGFSQCQAVSMRRLHLTVLFISSSSINFWQCRKSCCPEKLQTIDHSWLGISGGTVCTLELRRKRRTDVATEMMKFYVGKNWWESLSFVAEKKFPEGFMEVAAKNWLSFTVERPAGQKMKIFLKELLSYWPTRRDQSKDRLFGRAISKNILWRSCYFWPTERTET